MLNYEVTVTGEQLLQIEATLLNHVQPLSSHRCFPSLFAREKPNPQRIWEPSTQSGANVCVNPVRLKNNLAVGQSPVADTLRLEQRLFGHPVAEESRGAPVLRLLHERRMFGGSKKALG